MTVIKDEEKTKAELIKELSEAYRQIAGMEELKAEFQRVESVMRQAVIMAREEKTKADAIIAAIGDGISIQDTAYRVLLQNQMHKDMLGDHTGELCHRAYQNKESVCKGCHLAMSFRDGQIHKKEQIRVTDNGTRYYEITSSPLKDHAGRVIAGIEAVRDITERKRLEREVLKAEKLESLGVLAAGIAHEYNNVLTAISGNIALAKMYARPGSDMADIISESEKASQKAEKLTQQLLIFSKGGDLFKNVLSVSNILTDLTVRREDSAIKYELSLGSDLWPIEADDGQIRHAVMNIIENAKESMSGGGVIRIDAENIDTLPASIPGIPAGKYLKISVSDEGHGIDKTFIEKIFEPFFTTKEKRSGLGLTASFSVIRSHGGYLTAESGAGAGTTFHIYIPAASAGGQCTGDGDRYSIEKRKVLIMDDDELVTNVLEKMLEQCSCTSTFSRNGEEMLAKYREAMESGHPYDAVIIDLVIASGMNGKEAIKKLRELDPHARAVVSSGYSDDHIMSNFRDYGFLGALPKPYRIPGLSRVLRDVIAGTE